MKKPQLFLLHFAGGSSYSFQAMEPYLREFECIPLELPGRGKRMKEDLLQTFDEAVDDTVAQILKVLRPGYFVIFGHSLGAIIALKAASILESMNRFPHHVIVSGTHAPGVKILKKRCELEDEAFKVELKELGGTPEEVFANEDLYAFFAPIIKADFRVSEDSEFATFPIIRSPILALMGSEEEDVDKIDSWKEFSASGFESIVMEGDHFFIYGHCKEISDLIKSCAGNILIKS
ncbi:MAG TPA: alpha/beta fold hydrolase [Puia sp.]|jgi:surfactin synthase thioesterase subunit|nr:alpha/beta fold hydrolase [Puia sp.]